MGMLGHKIPVIFMKSRRASVHTILLTAFFALVTINIYKPFSSSKTGIGFQSLSFCLKASPQLFLPVCWWW